MKYIYPAVITQDDEGFYLAHFHDFDNSAVSCYTDGKNLDEAIDMAQDALNLALVTLEDDHAEIPKSSNPVKIKLKENEFLTMIKADTIEYRKKTDNKSVKKTLSIPQWLDTIAQRQKINFSQVLQKALMEACKIK